MKVLQIVLGLVKLHFLKCKINIIRDVAGTVTAACFTSTNWTAHVDSGYMWSILTILTTVLTTEEDPKKSGFKLYLVSSN